MDESCLVKKFSYYIKLNDTALRHIATLEEVKRDYPRHTEVVSEGDPITHLHTVREGWLYKYFDLPDGCRQIVRVFLPGDIVGFLDLGSTHATINLRSAENVRLCPFPKRKLDVILKELPRLTALLHTIANQDMVCMMDTLRAMGRMNAEERIFFFFLDIRARLKITNRSMTDTFRMPLNQHEIGDCLGLTHTYVSKSVRRMTDKGFISRDRDFIRLLKPGSMIDLIGFIDRYSNLDTSWFPESSS